MSRAARNRILVMVAALLLVGAAIAQVVAEQTPSGPPLSSYDSGPSGALAVYLWLRELGYQVSRIEDAASLEGVELLLVLEPVRRFERSEAQALVDWVERGGVLLYVPSLVPFTGFTPAPGASDGLASVLELGTPFGPYIEQATAVVPFFTTPPAVRFEVHAARSLDLQHDAWVPLLADGPRVVAATRQRGAGRVYVTTSSRLLANDGVGVEDNRAFLLNILARHPTRRQIAFEEYHHTVLERPDLANTVRTSPWGWALLYGAGLSFLFLVWAGRRFGPPVVPERAVARSGGDYIVAFAGLLQQARASSWVQRQYVGLVRRRLARELGVRPDLTAVDLARLLGERRRLDAAGLGSHLAALDGPPLPPQELLRRVREVEQILTQPAARPPAGAGSPDAVE